MVLSPTLAQGAVPKGNATKEFIESLQLKPGQVVYKCPKCCSIKPDRAHHCRYREGPVDLEGPVGPVDLEGPVDLVGPSHRLCFLPFCVCLMVQGSL